MRLIKLKLGPVVSPTTKYPWYHSIRSLTHSSLAALVQSSFAHHPKPYFAFTLSLSLSLLFSLFSLFFFLSSFFSSFTFFIFLSFLFSHTIFFILILYNSLQLNLISYICIQLLTIICKSQNFYTIFFNIFYSFLPLYFILTLSPFILYLPTLLNLFLYLISSY